MSQTDAPDDNDPGSWPSVAADPFGAPATAPEPDRDDGGEATDLRRRRRRVALAVVLALVVTAVVSSALIKVPYYRFAPGSLYATQSLITVDGATVYKGDGGQIDFTTVSSRRASVLDALFSRFDESTELISSDLIDGGRTTEQTRRENLEMMADAKQVAAVVALRRLGYEVSVQGTGALIKEVVAGMPAERVLDANDTVVAADGEPVRLGGDLVTIIGRHQPGESIALRVESAPGDPGRDVEAVLVSSCADNTPEEECTPEDAARPMLGVRLATRDTHFDLPVSLHIDTKDIGGPSAGLALTLGVIDVLTPGSLTGGAHVATTGTIDLDGNVGPIGGIKQKTFLAIRSGVSLFIVPEAQNEAADARAYAAGSDLQIVGVRTLDDAIQALRDHGGSVDVVDEVAKANAGTTEAPS